MAFNIYPLSSASGKFIPLDVYQPVEHHSIAVSSTPFTDANNFTFRDLATHMLLIFATIDMTIAFDQFNIVSDMTLGDMWIPANKIIPIYTDIPYVSALASDIGDLHINIIKLWDSLATEVQQSVS